MSTYIISFDENKKEAKHLLELIKALATNTSAITIEHLPNEETLKAINEVKEGKVFYAKDVDDLFEQIGE